MKFGIALIIAAFALLMGLTAEREDVYQPIVRDVVLTATPTVVATNPLWCGDTGAGTACFPK